MERFREQCRAFHKAVQAWLKRNTEYDDMIQNYKKRYDLQGQWSVVEIATPVRKPRRPAVKIVKGRYHRRDPEIAKQICSEQGAADRLLEILFVPKRSIEHWKAAHPKFRQAIDKGIEIFTAKGTKAVPEPGPSVLDLLKLPTFVDSIVNPFFDDEDTFTAEQKRQADYAMLAIVHDNELTDPRTPKIASGSVWPADEDWVGPVWKGVNETLRTEPALVCEQLLADLQRTLNRVKKDLAQAEQVSQREHGYGTYAEINLAERTITVGDRTHKIKNANTWQFLRGLVDTHKIGRVMPSREWKNALDTLRRQVGKQDLRRIVSFTRGVYILGPSVRLTGGSQIGIRRVRDGIRHKT
jgi:hypothetical protein